MKVVTSPTVYCIAEPKINWGVIAEILRIEFAEAEWVFTSKSDAELLCEFMGRMCYTAFGKKQGRKDTAEYLQNVMNGGHGSVLEHATFSFLVTGCSRGFTHQQVRHRPGWAYSQESSHFIRYSQDATICLPGLEGTSLMIASQQCYGALVAYDNICTELEGDIKAKGARKKTIVSTARGVLPTALESKLGMTGNLRAIRFLLELRGAEDNVLEQRLVMEQICNIVQRAAPGVFDDFKIRVADDGFPVVYTERFHKV